MVRTDDDAVRDRAADAGHAGEVSAPERKLAARVAHRLESDIIRRGWPVGEVLGSEQDLRARYGVSRSVLREAVRLAEHHQVARMRRGPGGGLFVCAPDAGPATRALVIYLEYVETSVEDLMQARQLLEPLAVALAAERITEQDIERLRAALDEETERGDAAGIFVQDEIHVLLGELSGNPALQLFVDVLSRLTTRYARTTRRIPKDEVARGQAETQERHRIVVDAVIGGAAGRAEAETVAHLARVSEWLLAYRARRGGKPAGRGPEGSGAKLAEVVAARIHDEIARRGWPIGQVLGSQADLLARHGISRAVLREAVRLLEYHSVARMRRGRGGGLVVTEPDPGASIETMALYLDYRGVTAEDLRVVRDAVELGTVQLAVRRRAEPEVAQRLKAALAWTGEPGRDGQSGSEMFHTELAEVSANPVLALFLRILTELWTRHRAGTDATPGPGPGAIAEVESVHERILDAVLAGDEGVARHRMRRHLEALAAWYH